jgi:RNase P subunit RPR2
MALTLEKSKKLIQVAEGFRKRAEALELAANYIATWVNEHQSEIELEISAWPCNECHSLHVRNVQSPFHVPQPDENGILTCCDCGATTTVDEARDLLKKLNKTFDRMNEEEKKKRNK